MACLSSCLLPELVAAAAAGGLREQDCRSAAGALSSSSSSSETGLRAIRGQNKKNSQLRLSSSTWIRGDSFKNERLSCVVAAAPPPPGMMALSKKQLRNEVQMCAATSKTSKISTGSGGAVLEDVPHLTDWLPDLPTYANPLKHNPAYSAVRQYFVESTDVVAKDVVVNLNTAGDGIHFRRAGPRDKIYFRPEEVKACIVTCGGLCPGLNTVIREIVCGLWTQYGVREIYGIHGGYRGFYSRNTTDLTPKVVNDIHKRGGTVLGTSRGGHDTSKIVDSIQDRGINQVYIIGGDGTQKGANVIHEECKKRGLKVVVAGIPKTIDNDIEIIDKSFGFDTAVEEAQRAINAAHVEAESFQNGVGLVKLMGRYSGYIAMHATLASRDVDLCLIPEVPFYLDGPGGLKEFAKQRLRENGHMVIVVAEGAGQELIAETMGSLDKLSDASGNRLLLDVGLWLSQNLKDHFVKEFKEPLNLKYIDPTYMVRAIPSNASDNVYCTLLAHSAIHGAMAGYCGFTVGPVNNRHCYIPISRVTATQRQVNIADRMWARLLSSTNQPNFLRYNKYMLQLRKQNALKQALESEQHVTVANSNSTPSSPSSSTDGNGNGRFKRVVEESPRMETGDRQYVPLDTEEASLLTTPVPGDPTQIHNHTAP